MTGTAGRMSAYSATVSTGATAPMRQRKDRLRIAVCRCGHESLEGIPARVPDREHAHAPILVSGHVVLGVAPLLRLAGAPPWRPEPAARLPVLAGHSGPAKRPGT